ncbi:hypothetical protein, partial [Klebsiella pneumoniae]|uniref:hypothetical protein n=1 Tax=Klebsiella pneumoniae TaxID=573 RepID=UPI0025A10F7C
AVQLLEEKRSALHEFRLRKDAQEDIGMVCGGDVTVLLQYVAWNDALWQQTARILLGRLSENRGGWLVQ